MCFEYDKLALNLTSISYVWKETTYQIAETSCYAHRIMSFVDIFYAEQNNPKHLGLWKFCLWLNHVN